ncbi:MFS transporter [Burkholderia pseudomultivorans]|uniref:MFS transporter n=1 Tax=Burkholderia pseudomultivorans TaxID=1207504 RepID=UPI00075F0660|nr:MFS transporter [Burkholderia pseudomultivorans]KWF06467.1 MFS transporter [Burkholderia pseudomultivorans]
MRQINATTLADDARFTRFHAIVLFWCAMAIVFDGYDLAVSGIALPAIMEEMGVSATQAGFMVSSALFGMMFGNALFGALSDRIGRRTVIVVCIALFSLCTAAAGLTHGPVAFSAMRFLAGLGLGGVMPSVIAQMSEYAPARIRSTLITGMFSGYSVGGMLAATLGKGLIESHGWQAVYIVAAAPVVLLPWVWRQMPEAMSFLVAHGRDEELKAILARLSPTYVPKAGDRLVLDLRPKEANVPLRVLFSDGRGFSTVMFWVTCFMSLFMVYALSAWLVKLMISAGYNLGSALTFVLLLNIGATVGAIAGGWFADRLPIKVVITTMFVMAALSIALLGHPMPGWLLFMLVGVAGACTIGTQTLACAYCGQFYPASCRGTGVGLMLAVGRAGGILAPVLIGVVVSLSLPLGQNFLVIAAPALLAAVTISLVDHRRSALIQQRAAAASV